MGLELYAKVESLLGFDNERKRLYEIYLNKLKLLGLSDILDIGCGSGAFMELAAKEGIESDGIDLSTEMVKMAKSRGLSCEVRDICGVEKKYEGAVALFDVLNYVPPKDVKRFLRCVRNTIEPGGFFLCDINTLYGFEEVAQGALWIEKGDEFVAVEAEFDKKRLDTKIVYFHKDPKGCYIKENDTITQYYHDINELKIEGFEIVDLDFVALFSQEPDKALITYKRV